MRLLAQKTSGGIGKRKLAIYCRILNVSRSGYYKYLSRQNRPWKYQGLAEAMRAIQKEDVCSDMYGRKRMRQALLLKQPEGVTIPSERAVYRVMNEIGLIRRSRCKTKGITKADREARKSDGLLKRNFQAEKPLEKSVTDIIEIKAKNGKLAVCFGGDIAEKSAHLQGDFCAHGLQSHPGYFIIDNVVIPLVKPESNRCAAMV